MGGGAGSDPVSRQGGFESHMSCDEKVGVFDECVVGRRLGAAAKLIAGQKSLTRVVIVSEPKLLPICSFTPVPGDSSLIQSAFMLKVALFVAFFPLLRHH